MDLRDLQRLMALDAALVGDGGLHVETFADEWECTGKTVGRLLRLVRQLGRETVVDRDPETSRHTHRYAAGAVRLFAGVAGDPAKKTGRRRVLDRNEMRRLRDQGATNNAIAQAVGCSETYVRTALGNSGRPAAKKRLHNYAEIRRLAESGMLMQEIGVRTGAPMSVIYRAAGDLLKRNRAARAAKRKKEK